MSDAAGFWDRAWAELGVIGERGEGPAIVPGERLSQVRFYPGARLSFAENLLRPDLPAGEAAIIAHDETGIRRVVTRGELAEQARQVRGHPARPGRRSRRPGGRMAAERS